MDGRTDVGKDGVTDWQAWWR